MVRTAVLLGLAVVAFASGSGAAPAGVVRLGAVIPLTGRFASGGAQVRAGYEMAVEDLNARGGVRVGGQQLRLELVVVDDESDPTKTVSRMEALAQQDVAVYLGGFGSDLHAAAAAVAEKNRTPYCGVAFALWGIHQRGYKYLFSPFPKSPEMAIETYRMLNGYLLQDQRPRRVAIFAERTDWGREISNLWSVRSTEFGYQVVFRGEYTVGTRDLSDLILRAKAAGAELVLGVPTPPDGITLVRQMKELDFNPKALLLIRAPDAPAWSQSLGRDGDYTLLMPGWHPGVKFPGAADLNRKHQERFGRPADVLVGPAYACVQVAADAVQRAGSLDRERIREAMASTSLRSTVVGPVRFRPDGTSPVTTVVVQWQAGRQELVWPREFATRPLAYPAAPWRNR
ncbi:MAG: amino acid ABC transporter substrate-binding protein [Armatimonadota bacterium]|nr:amino acid ABC transporter substrate-binding protein [Armatimonadota bacterium]MDR7389114.1 amino acid ABC transporter substrate-binding protein [Armatimonadota bacterium]MDR7391407.1 amino acid ABC transporter substrate-binding protein [Armatimonadota bacterium]MDR7393462.1 amino acid ABC transporter substrate-binding protein [Armatimonadota bacterium]MDR7396710.1 amino acid ABC transporter substrate-binding protein [Armatimonadota bacterium]